MGGENGMFDIRGNKLFYCIYLSNIMALIWYVSMQMINSMAHCEVWTF